MRDERVPRMLEMFQSGQTLREIGEHYNLTRERIRQLLNTQRRYCRDIGGVHVAAKKRAVTRRARNDAKSIARFGMTSKQRLALSKLQSCPNKAYVRQRQSAKDCGYAWNMTFAEWWNIWKASGNWRKRGTGRWVMARKDPSKPFQVDNVEITTQSALSVRTMYTRYHSK